MIRALFTLLLLAGISNYAAAGWFSDDTSEDSLDSLEYCTGLVIGGLQSMQVAGPTRTSLWLAWSYMIRSGALNGERGSAQVIAGRQKSSDSLDAATILANLDEADGSCGLGRSNRQISGW